MCIDSCSLEIALSFTQSLKRETIAYLTAQTNYKKKSYLQELFCLYYGFLGNRKSPFYIKKAEERLHKAINTINCRVKHNIIKSYGNCPISFIPFASDNQV